MSLFVCQPRYLAAPLAIAIALVAPDLSAQFGGRPSPPAYAKSSPSPVSRTPKATVSKTPSPTNSPKARRAPLPAGAVQASQAECGGMPKSSPPHPRPLVPASPSIDSVAGSPDEKRAAVAAARAFRGARFSGKATKKAVRKLERLHWHDSLSAAAREAARQNKPILYIQALGDLDGFT